MDNILCMLTMHSLKRGFIILPQFFKRGLLHQKKKKKLNRKFERPFRYFLLFLWNIAPSLFFPLFSSSDSTHFYRHTQDPSSFNKEVLNHTHTKRSLFYPTTQPYQIIVFPLCPWISCKCSLHLVTTSTVSTHSSALLSITILSSTLKNSSRRQWV